MAGMAGRRVYGQPGRLIDHGQVNIFVYNFKRDIFCGKLYESGGRNNDFDTVTAFEFSGWTGGPSVYLDTTFFDKFLQV